MNVIFKNSGYRVAKYELTNNILSIMLGNMLTFDLESLQSGKSDKHIIVFATNGILNTVSGMEKIAEIIIKQKKQHVVEADESDNSVCILDYSDFNINTDVELILWDSNFVRNSR